MSPIVYQWNGEAMVPMRRFAKQCDREFVIGEFYPLVVEEARSMRSHAHYFAAVNSAWENLPEDLAPRFKTAEHLRKYALIRTGFHDERSIVCSSTAEAERVAAFVKPVDEFAVVLVNDATVTIFTAKSQSLRAMDRKEFQRSKELVLEFLSARIGVKRDELEAAAA